MITGPRAAFVDALEALDPAQLRLAWAGAPTVDVPTAFVALSAVTPDPTRCAHVTEVTVLVICQFTDPELAGDALDAAADLVVSTLEPFSTFTGGSYGVYRETAPSVLLKFDTRQ